MNLRTYENGRPIWVDQGPGNAASGSRTISGSLVTALSGTEPAKVHRTRDARAAAAKGWITRKAAL